MSNIVLISRTADAVRLAIFQKPVCNPNLPTIAWQIAAPPPGGTLVVALPEDFSLQARYSNDQSRPENLDTSAKPMAFAETSAAFTIDSVMSQDRMAVGAVINQTFNDLVPNEVRVKNNYSIGVEASILRGLDPIYEPQIIWPGGLFVESVCGSLCVAVVSPFTCKGQRLVQEEISITQTEVLEDDALVVSGSQWTGYALSRP
ncbi:TPA: hypothetical protein QDZ42_000563 [Stenotrophomonas maltophilia]|nr:hypothetical protein [Stenotrophomonas maltophilia]HDS1041950.1 hypothetical protein [Stenotrophomonas maltophilia]